jgi:hypothetical protein
MKSDKYNDLKDLSKWINNQKAFEKHKKQLDQIYLNLNKKTSQEFGLTDNKTFEFLENKLQNVYLIHKFNEKEKNMEIDKENENLDMKLKIVQSRKNVFFIRNHFS